MKDLFINKSIKYTTERREQKGREVCS